MITQDASVPTPPAPPQIARILVDGKPLVNAQALYQGFLHQRQELNRQMASLQDERRSVGERIREDGVPVTEKPGLERRLTSLEARIEAVDKQLAVADAQVASAAAVPGAVVDPPPEHRDGPPEEFWVLGGIFMFVTLLPISLAYARRVWRRGASVAAAIPSDIVERFTRLDQAVESIAVEVERIGEGQRFITKVFGEQSARPALGEGAARAAEVRRVEAEPLRRPSLP